MGNIKGSAWITALEFAEKKFGKDAREKIFSRLSPLDQKEASRLILAGGWMPHQTYMNFLLALDKLYGKGDFALVTEASVYNADKDMRGIYKFFISLASPQMLIKSGAMLYSQYYDTGKASVEMAGKTRGYFKITNYPDIPLHHEWNMSAFIGQCFKMSGVKQVASKHLKCIARGDESCLWDFSWDLP